MDNTQVDTVLVGQGGTALIVWRDTPPDAVPNAQSYADQGELIAVPQSPPVFAGMLRRGSGFVVPPKSISEARADAHARISLWRQRRFDAGFTYDGVVYDSDTDSRALIQGAAVRAQIDKTYTEVWKAADDSLHELDATQLKGLFKALGDHISLTFAHGESLRAEIEAADTPAHVATIVSALEMA